jgi:hypothetical protein
MFLIPCQHAHGEPPVKVTIPSKVEENSAENILGLCLGNDPTSCLDAQNQFTQIALRYYDHLERLTKTAQQARVYTNLVDYSLRFLSAVTRALQACRKRPEHQGPRVNIAAMKTVCGTYARQQHELFSDVVKRADARVKGRKSLGKVLFALTGLITQYNPPEPPEPEPKPEPKPKPKPEKPEPPPLSKGLWAGLGISVGGLVISTVTSATIAVMLRRGGPLHQQIAQASDSAGSYDPWSPDLCNDQPMSEGGSAEAFGAACTRRNRLRTGFNVSTFAFIPVSLIATTVLSIVIARKRRVGPPASSLASTFSSDGVFVHAQWRF